MLCAGYQGSLLCLDFLELLGKLYNLGFLACVDVLELCNLGFKGSYLGSCTLLLGKSFPCKVILAVSDSQLRSDIPTSDCLLLGLELGFAGLDVSQGLCS